MMIARSHLVRLLAPLGVLATLTGCPNPNTYGTPRTIPAGKVQIVASLEGVGVSVKEGPVTEAFYSPTLPSAGVRIGLADNMDIGIRLAQLSAIGADFKYNFFKSHTFDMAVDPGFQGTYLATSSVGAGIFYFNVPLLLGINFNRVASLILTPGFTYLVATATESGGGSSAFATGSAPLARLGVGVNLRVAKTVALQPEITALKGFNSADVLYWNFGVGVSIGTSQLAMPDYSDQN